MERKIEVVLQEKEELIKQVEARDLTIERMRAENQELESRITQSGVQDRASM